MNLEQMKTKLLRVKEQRAKSRGRLDQLLDSLQKDYGIRSLVEARGLLVDLEKERDQKKEVFMKRESKLEKRVHEFFGKNANGD